MNTHQRELWVRYLAAEEAGERQSLKDSLGAFIDSLAELDEEALDSFAREIARQASERKHRHPIRYPLFNRVIGPSLVRGVLSGVPGCARWLAHFDQELLAPRGVCEALPEHLRSPEALLLEALRVDPGDTASRRQLIEKQARYLAYTLHEVPAGVLYGHDAASAHECAELLDYLSDFEEHVQTLGDEDSYRELIADCRFHYSAYRDYLRSGRANGSYQAFVSKRRGT